MNNEDWQDVQDAIDKPLEDKHPDILRRPLMGVEEQDEYLRLVKEFEKGIRYELRRGVTSEVLHDLVCECFARYTQEYGRWTPQTYGKDVAKRWLRANFKEEQVPHSNGKKKWKAKCPTFGSLTRQDSEGEDIAFDIVDASAIDDAPYMPENYSVFKATTDYEICLRYIERKDKQGNRFTEQERTQYESALRRLRKKAGTQ